jgi:hypothetical protein
MKKINLIVSLCAFLGMSSAMATKLCVSGPYNLVPLNQHCQLAAEKNQSVGAGTFAVDNKGVVCMITNLSKKYTDFTIHYYGKDHKAKDFIKAIPYGNTAEIAANQFENYAKWVNIYINDYQFPMPGTVEPYADIVCHAQP